MNLEHYELDAQATPRGGFLIAVDKYPATTTVIERLQTVLSTGLVMKLLEADIDQPQFPVAGCTCTGIPCLRFKRLVVATL